jgi:hypothetical protein
MSKLNVDFVGDIGKVEWAVSEAGVLRLYRHNLRVDQGSFSLLRLKTAYSGESIFGF